MIQPSIQNVSVSAVASNIFEQLLDISGLRSASIQVSGTFVLSLIVEVSNDAEDTPTNWDSVAVIPSDGRNAVTEITAPGLYIIPVAYKAMRVRCATYSSGEAEVKAIFSQNDAAAQSAFQGDALERFRVSDIDDASSTQYYGYIDEVGRWYIMRFDTATKQLRYAKGGSGYSDNWTDRAALSYEYFNVSF